MSKLSPHGRHEVIFFMARTRAAWERERRGGRREREKSREVVVIILHASTPRLVASLLHRPPRRAARDHLPASRERERVLQASLVSATVL
jgi:hypothetical protein